MSGALHTTAYGTSGPRVVFLHGLFGQGRNWTGIGKALADQARVLLVDLPDHGRSPWSQAFSYGAMADRVADLLQATGDDEPWCVVGHSMGGKVAMVLALRRPDLVGRLCVVDVSPVPSLAVGGFGTYVDAMRAVDLDHLADRSQAEQQLAERIDDPSIRGFLLQNLRREGSGGDARWRWQMNLALLGDHLDAVGDWPDPGPVTYDGPVLWVAGSDSSYVTPGYGPAMRALFPRVHLVKVKGAGHWVHADRPEVFVAALRSFAGLAPGVRASAPDGPAEQ